MIESWNESGKDPPWGTSLVTSCQLDLSPFTTKSLDSATQPVLKITLPELLCLLGFASIPASPRAAMT